MSRPQKSEKTPYLSDPEPVQVHHAAALKVFLQIDLRGLLHRAVAAAVSDQDRDHPRWNDDVEDLCRRAAPRHSGDDLSDVGAGESLGEGSRLLRLAPVARAVVEGPDPGGDQQRDRNESDRRHPPWNEGRKPVEVVPRRKMRTAVSSATPVMRTVK